MTGFGRAERGGDVLAGSLPLLRRNLSRALPAAGRHFEAERALPLAHESQVAAHGTEDAETRRTAALLVELYDAMGAPEKAADFCPSPPGER